MNLQFHVKSPEKYQKYTQASIFVDSLRDIYYFGYNFASQTVKQTVIYRNNTDMLAWFIYSPHNSTKRLKFTFEA